jgi:hypothetical protein
MELILYATSVSIGVVGFDKIHVLAQSRIKSGISLTVVHPVHNHSAISGGILSNFDALEPPVRGGA